MSPRKMSQTVWCRRKEEERTKEEKKQQKKNKSPPPSHTTGIVFTSALPHWDHITHKACCLQLQKHQTDFLLNYTPPPHPTPLKLLDISEGARKKTKKPKKLQICSTALLLCLAASFFFFFIYFFLNESFYDAKCFLCLLFFFFGCFFFPVVWFELQRKSVCCLTDATQESPRFGDGVTADFWPEGRSGGRRCFRPCRRKQTTGMTVDALTDDHSAHKTKCAGKTFPEEPPLLQDSIKKKTASLSWFKKGVCRLVRNKG